MVKLMTEPSDATRVLLDWMALFMRRSVHDMLQFNKVSGLSLAQANILMWLHYHKPCEVTSLAEIMQVSPAAASQMVERMVQQGLVTRSEIPGDRRVRLVHLTDQGKKLVLESIQVHEEWVQQLAASLTPKQQSDSAGILKMLTDKARQMQLG